MQHAQVGSIPPGCFYGFSNPQPTLNTNLDDNSLQLHFPEPPDPLPPGNPTSFAHLPDPGKLLNSFLGHLFSPISVSPAPQSAGPPSQQSPTNCGQIPSPADMPLTPHISHLHSLNTIGLQDASQPQHTPSDSTPHTSDDAPKKTGWKTHEEFLYANIHHLMNAVLHVDPYMCKCNQTKEKWQEVHAVVQKNGVCIGHDWETLRNNVKTLLQYVGVRSLPPSL